MPSGRPSVNPTGVPMKAPTTGSLTLRAAGEPASSLSRRAAASFNQPVEATGARHSSQGVTGNLTILFFVGSLLPAPVAHFYR